MRKKYAVLFSTRSPVPRMFTNGSVLMQKCRGFHACARLDETPLLHAWNYPRSGRDAAIPPDPVLIRFAELMSSTISWSFEETPVGWIKAEAIWGDVMPSVLQGAGAGD